VTFDWWYEVSGISKKDIMVVQEYRGLSVWCRERKVPQVFDIGDPRLSKKEEYGRCL
jgi:hypothetical protein